MKKRIRDAFIILAITLLALAALEGGARLMGAAPAKPLLSSWMHYDDLLLWKIRPHSHGAKGSRFAPTISFRHNQFGMRMKEIEREKPQGVFRAAVLGDSNIWGFGVEQAQTACSILQERFDENPPGGQRVEILNMGTIGYSSFQGRVLLETTAFEFDPDLAIVSFGYNDRRYVADPSRQDRSDYFEKTAGTARWVEFLFGSSALFNQLAPPINAQETNLLAASPRVPLRDYLKNFKAMIHACNQRQVPLVVLALSDNRYEVRRIDEARYAAGLAGNLYSMGSEPPSDEAVKEAVRILIDPSRRPTLADAYMAPMLLLQLAELKPEACLPLLGYDQSADQALLDFRAKLSEARLPIDSVMGMTPLHPDWMYSDMLQAELEREHPAARFIQFSDHFKGMDLEEAKTYFLPNDPCHMTPKGQALLADTLEETIQSLMK